MKQLQLVCELIDRHRHSKEHISCFYLRLNRNILPCYTTNPQLGNGSVVRIARQMGYAVGHKRHVMYCVKLLYLHHILYFTCTSLHYPT